jgi:hypothetical protein
MQRRQRKFAALIARDRSAGVVGSPALGAHAAE